MFLLELKIYDGLERRCLNMSIPLTARDQIWNYTQKLYRMIATMK
jgi:hypothetical protein